MKKIFVPHTEVYVLWCCKVKSDPFYSIEQRARHLPTLYQFFEDSPTHQATDATSLLLQNSVVVKHSHKTCSCNTI